MKAGSILALVIAVLLGVGSGSAGAAVLTVNQSGTWGSGPAAYVTVQSAIDAASAGDEIWVARGTYFENLVAKDGVALYGGFAGVETGRAQRNWNANRTILDGALLGSILYVPSYVSATIDGFTIQNGTGTNYSWLRSIEGGGILGLQYSSLTIANNLFKGNSAVYGGGVSIKESSTCTVYNNVFFGNVASQQGGGLALTYAYGTVANNTFVDNTGFAYMSWNSDATVMNNIFKSNGDAGVYVLANARPLPIMDSNCYFGNSAGDYVGIAPGAHDLAADPLFADPATEDFHLVPESPAINAGDNQIVAGLTGQDVDGELRIRYGTVDIGADEWANPSTPVVVGTDPAGFAAGVSLSQLVRISYDRSVLAGPAFDQVIITYKKGSQTVAIPTQKSISGNVLTITPTVNYPVRTQMTVSLPAGAVKDVALAGPFSFFFTTVRR